MRGVVLSRRAGRDVRRLSGEAELTRIRQALEGLAGAATLVVKALAGSAPWHRLRVGDFRILCRAVEAGEGADSNARWLVARSSTAAISNGRSPP